MIWGENTHWLYSLSRMFDPRRPDNCPMSSKQLLLFFFLYVNTSFLPKILFHVYMFENWSLSGGLRMAAYCFWHGSLFWLDAHAMTDIYSTVFGCHDSLLFSLKKLLQKNAKHLTIRSWKNSKTSDKNDCFNYNSNTVFTLEAPGYTLLKIQAFLKSTLHGLF